MDMRTEIGEVIELGRRLEGHCVLIEGVGARQVNDGGVDTVQDMQK
jgi:hypothetical protein